MTKNSKSLQKKVIIAQIVFGIVICTIINIVVGIIYRHEILEDIKEECYSYAHLVSSTIDGDRISYYYENGEKDDYYQEILDYLNKIQSESSVLYLYVYVPEEHEIVYIWDAEKKGNNCELGQREKYMDDGEKIIKEVYRKDSAEKLYFEYIEGYGKLGVANYPIFNSEGEPVAVVGVDLSTKEINQEIFKFILIVTACIFAIIFVSIVIDSFVINKTIVTPIYVLKNATKKLVDNLNEEDNVSIEIESNDEFGELARAYETMYRNVRDYMVSLEQVTAEKERIASELNVATQIQADMLPSKFPPFPDRSEFNIYATMAPAKEVGGDFYDFFLIDDNHLALVMADVSGKGVPAALFMVISKTMIKNRALMGGTPAEILSDVNNQLSKDNEAGLFVTTWLAIIDLTTGKALASNAGHEYPAIKRKEGDFELLKRKHSPALAAFEDVTYLQYEFELCPGDRIYVYTDGVPEATNGECELYGTDRMLVSLNARKAESLENVLAGMKEDIEKFVGTAPQFDDITMMCFDYYGK